MTRKYTRGEHGTNKERIKLPADFIGNDAARQKERRAIVRREVIKHYGGKCECCGEEHIEFLCIDHISGGGTKERKNNNKRGNNFYLYLRRMSFPEGYRILCHNCNSSIGIYGYCPHSQSVD
jgi:hypothetical protein